MANTMKICYLTAEEAADVMENPKAANRQLFLVDCTRARHVAPCWVAIDNTTGDGFAKKFKTREEAERWLTE